LFTDGNKRYLVYAYSRDEGGHISYIGAFDIEQRKEVYRSEAYEACDIIVAPRMDNHFIVVLKMHDEDEYGQFQYTLGYDHLGFIGYLKFEEGTFSFFPSDDEWLYLE